METVIDLGRRLIELDGDTQLHFTTDDDIFHLRVVALVAQKMKERARAGDADCYVPIGDIEDQAWTWNAGKPRPYRSKRSMRENIYQTWRARLRSRLTTKSFTTGTLLTSDQAEEFFKCAEGHGPHRAVYRIGGGPEAIEIVPENASGNEISTGIWGRESMEGLTDEQKAQRLVDVLFAIASPWTYKETFKLSFRATQLLWNSKEVRHIDHRGRLSLSMEECADIFVSFLGVTGVPGRSVMPTWLTQLSEDPWWEAMMTANRKLGGGVVRNHEAEPEAMIQKCIMLGDFVFLGWLFHRAYVASVVAQRRDEFLLTLRRQTGSVQEVVYAKWHEQLAGTGGGDSMQIFQRGEAVAFRYLQVLTQISLPYIE